MKLICLLFFIFLISCGKSPDGGYYVPQDWAPVTFNVPKDKYNKFKEQFDAAEALIRSKTGKQLVIFTPSDLDPKYETGLGASKDLGKEHWVLFKENYTTFTDVTYEMYGVSYSSADSGKRIYKSIIVFNFTDSSFSSYWANHFFEQTLLHETLHCLGFDHTFGDDLSVMNASEVFRTDGLYDLDVTRLAAKYPFSMEVVTIKDLEKIAYQKQSDKIEKLSFGLSENFGLSIDRAKVVAQSIISYQAIQNKRALNNNELDIFSKNLMGFSYQEGKKALEKFIQGDSSKVDQLLSIAAEKNGISPENMKDLFGQYFQVVNASSSLKLP